MAMLYVAVKHRGSLAKWIIAGVVVVLLLATGLVAAIIVVVGGGAGLAGGSSSSTQSLCDQNHPVGVTLTISTLSAEQKSDAAVIIGVGMRRKIAAVGVSFALAIALRESNLINLQLAVDHDSLGIFQQRPSQGWGTPAQLVDPVYATNAFYTHMLQNIADYATEPLDAVVRAVQNPAAATVPLYDQSLPLAKQILAAANPFKGGALQVDSANCGVPAAPNTKVQVVLNALYEALAQKWPYCWDGGNASGPTQGTDCAPGQVGFDCSGLTLYVYAKIGIVLPHDAARQANMGQAVALSDLKPGDLVFFGGSMPTIHHVGVFIGKVGDSYQMIDTPTEGKTVMYHYFYGPGNEEGDYIAARRYV